MSTRPLLSAEEYLRMHFDGPAPEYVDGELVERHLGDPEHSYTQVRLIEALAELRGRGVFVYPELHLKIGANFRVVDIAIYAEKLGRPIPSHPPLVTIEINSPNDRMREIREKCEEYRRWGVRHIWLVEPYSRRLSLYDESGLRDVPRFELPECDLTISPDRIFE